MTITHRIQVVSVTAACLMSLASAQAQQTQPGVRQNDPTPSIHTDRSPTAASVVTDKDANPVSKANKASSLVGMEVRNTQNEKLGEIKDLAIDLPSGKIAYAVLSVGGFLGIGDKYVAVPPSAFHVAPDEHTIVLDADKAKVQNAPGFAKNDWPDVKADNTFSSYWLSSPTTAQGTTSVTTSGTGSGHSDRTGATAAPSTPAAVGNATEPSGQRHVNVPDSSGSTFKGRITAINPERRTVTVEGPSGVREFKLSDHASLALKENRNPHLTDFKVGYPVTVGFEEQNGAFVARSLIRSDAPEVR